MSSQVSKNNRNAKKFNVVRRKSILQASNAIKSDFRPITLFRCTLSVTAGSLLLSLIKVAGQFIFVALISCQCITLTLKFKKAEKPGTSDTGKIITNGPEKVIERVGDYKNLQKDFGIQPEDMNLNAVFQRVYRELEDEKNIKLPWTPNLKKVRENAAKMALVDDN